MSLITANLERVSLKLRTDILQSNLQRTNVKMLKTQNAMSTGKRVDKPSDDPGAVNTIASLESIMATNTQQGTNANLGLDYLNNTEAALSEISDILLEATGVGLSQIGVVSDNATRQSVAEVITQQYNGLLEIANRDYLDVYLFGGNQAGTRPFEDMAGGLRYLGPRENLNLDMGLSQELGVNSNGVEAFNALSSRVVGNIDLDPGLTSNTKLIDVKGARDRGVMAGPVSVTVNGIQSYVDLSDVATIGDVLAKINEAITNVDPLAGGLAINGSTLALTATAGNTISIEDVGDAKVAADLGIVLSASDSTETGEDVYPMLTQRTETAALGASIDWAGGVQVSNGVIDEVVDLSSCRTIQDMINAFALAEVGCRLEINDARTGLNLVNELSGPTLSVGENGGSTATDLGIRSFENDTPLSDFRNGRGVEISPDVADFQVNLHDGRSFQVNLDGSTTVGDVIDAIQSAAQSAGIAVPGEFKAGYVDTGNGFKLTDATVGGGDFQVVGVNYSVAAENLGLEQSAGVGNQITTGDGAPVRTESLFSHMMMLQDALLLGDETEIGLAVDALQDDVTHIAEVRAQVGIRTQRVESQVAMTDKWTIQYQSLLSQSQDQDMAEAISRMSILQTQLQANLRAGSQMTQISLMDFLR